MRMAQIRQQAEEAIERLIALLDEMDGDADLEPNGDLEPSLGVGRLWSPAHGHRYTSEDLEGHDASDEPDDSSWTSPQTLNPPPIRAKRVTARRAA